MSISYVVSWSVVSSGLILLNKYILSNLDFHYPLTLSRHATLTVSPQKWSLTPARHSHRTSPTRSLGMGFSSLASALLIHVFKTHRLEHKMSRDFYVRRVLPMGFFMVRPNLRSALPPLRRLTHPPAPAAGGDPGVRQPGIPVLERQLHTDPQGCHTGHDHDCPRGRAPGQAQHAGASLAR